MTDTYGASFPSVADKMREQEVRIRELEASNSELGGINRVQQRMIDSLKADIAKAKAILEPFKLSPEVHAARAIRLALAALEGK